MSTNLIIFLRKLLIAENNKNDITFYQSLFSSRNFRVLIATDSKESLRKYRAEMENAAAAAISKKQIREKKEKKGLKSKDHFFVFSSPVVMPFDAVVLNHRVSDTDGIHVAKEILSINPHQRIVFVSESTKYTTELQNEFKEKVDVIQKPFYPEALIELLESAELYRALKDLGVNVQKIREANLYHFQLFDLLAACREILRENDGREKKTTDKVTGMVASSSDNRFPPDVVRQALDKALDNLGPRLKPVLWDLLEKECGTTSFRERAPTLLQLEVALKNVFGDTSYIILDWFLEELEKYRKDES